MRAHLSRSGALTSAMILFLGLTVWSIHHFVNIWSASSGTSSSNYYWAYVFTFVIFAVAIVMAHREKPLGDDDVVDDYRVAVIVPAYNEDPAVLKDCLDSLLTQSRLPDEIFVTDDGSDAVDYTQISKWLNHEAANKRIAVGWHRKENEGKRRAQAVAVKATPDATIYVTVDSDSVLDHEAIKESLKPFHDPKIQSVAGVILARNNRTNLLARFTDLLFVTGQLVDRSMMSSVGSVLVNSGGLATYRAEILRDNLDAYVNETFFGRKIEFSDDSMLTLYALKRGKTVQQPTAFVFTMMPEKLSHHLRQQVRWMKGSFIRSWWRLKYLPINSFGFGRQLVSWMQLAMVTVIFVVLFIVQPISYNQFSWSLLLVPVLLGYSQALRYFSIRRTDERFLSRLLTYLLAPVASLWAYFVLRPVRLYAIMTSLRTGWGTRKNVEVSLKLAPVQHTPATIYKLHLAYIDKMTSSGQSLADLQDHWQQYFNLLPLQGKHDYWTQLYA